MRRPHLCPRVPLPSTELVSHRYEIHALVAQFRVDLFYNLNAPVQLLANQTTASEASNPQIARLLRRSLARGGRIQTDDIFGGFRARE